MRSRYYCAAQHLAGSWTLFVFRWCRVAVRWLENAAIALDVQLTYQLTYQQVRMHKFTFIYIS